jgi:cyanophycinase-like exopeptidase
MIDQNLQQERFGPIVIFGSGETSLSGQRIFDQLFQQLPENPRVSLLETPAGFELNSHQVIERVAQFFQQRLQNYNPKIDIITARKRGTAFSPNNANIAAPLLYADLIFAGPGSPTYTVRQLQDTVSWHYLVARHRMGSALVFASAAAIALGTHVIPVYEIYKAGHDLHWIPGLNFFAAFHLPVVIVPHWNNQDGGKDLDTSHCFLGRSRFEAMLAMLPKNQIVIGIDEHTALWMDCADQCFQVMGLGTITIIKDGEHRVISSGGSFPLHQMADCSIPDSADGIPNEVWKLAQQVESSVSKDEVGPPQNVVALSEKRQQARDRKDWATSDEIRAQIAGLGWHVKDTPDGPVLSKL